MRRVPTVAVLHAKREHFSCSDIFLDFVDVSCSVKTVEVSAHSHTPRNGIAGSIRLLYCDMFQWHGRFALATHPARNDIFRTASFHNPLRRLQRLIVVCRLARQARTNLHRRLRAARVGDERLICGAYR